MAVRTFEKRRIARGTATLLSALLLGAGNLPLAAQETAPEAAAEQTASKLSNDELDSLVAPIALYPDPLLSQALVASTYPLEIIQASQWMTKNSSLKGEALEKAALEQDWDPSIQAMVALPDMVKRLTEDITWTTNLGNAFLAQQDDVMAAVQRLRLKARDAGKLESSEQQKVETKVVESKTVVVIQPASTQVVYLPTYSPTVIWGPPVYPYPPVYYPPGAGLVTFGMGMAMGAAISNGGWGWGCGWGGREQQHHDQQQQQLHQPQQREEQRELGQPVQQQLEPQRVAPRRSALRGQEHGQQVRRERPRRLGVGAPGAGPHGRRREQPAGAAALFEHAGAVARGWRLQHECEPRRGRRQLRGEPQRLTEQLLARSGGGAPFPEPPAEPPAPTAPRPAVPRGSSSMGRSGGGGRRR